eukprot:TRINITY_DN1810_c0_g1_i1.p1 TRINITY_DN1810_c0_g1~~TRINITY_DN1810_c0_g1_i1.p1  ORF type:complete len:557 (+),score=141.85 TRINITY_DN1810_c0_g1_i1:171-1841(+)
MNIEEPAVLGEVGRKHERDDFEEGERDGDRERDGDGGRHGDKQRELEENFQQEHKKSKLSDSHDLIADEPHQMDDSIGLQCIEKETSVPVAMLDPLGSTDLLAPNIPSVQLPTQSPITITTTMLNMDDAQREAVSPPAQHVPATNEVSSPHHHVDDAEDIASLIRVSRNIIVLTGAGISRAAGIPTFRGPNGLFEQLSEEFPELSDPAEALDRWTLEDQPHIVYSALRRLWPRDEWKPTLGHLFLRLLHEKGRLLRLYTQNIDDLDVVAGIPHSRLNRLHGNFENAFYLDQKGRKHFIPSEEIRPIVCEKNSIPVVCLKHIGEKKKGTLVEYDENECNPNLEPDKFAFVRPEVILYHDDVSQNMTRWYQEDEENCDMVIVIGTSLQVAPANTIARPPRIVQLPDGDPAWSHTRVWVNRSRPPMAFDFDFETENRPDFRLISDSDEMAMVLCDHLGWRDELDALSDFFNRRGPIIPRLIEAPSIRNTLLARMMDRVSSRLSFSKWFETIPGGPFGDMFRKLGEIRTVEDLTSALDMEKMMIIVQFWNALLDRRPEQR